MIQVNQIYCKEVTCRSGSLFRIISIDKGKKNEKGTKTGNPGNDSDLVSGA